MSVDSVIMLVIQRRSFYDLGPGPWLVRLGEDRYTMSEDAFRVLEHGAGLIDLAWQVPVAPGVPRTGARRLSFLLALEILSAEPQNAGRVAEIRAVLGVEGSDSPDWAFFDWLVEERAKFVQQAIANGVVHD